MNTISGLDFKSQQYPEDRAVLAIKSFVLSLTWGNDGFSSSWDLLYQVGQIVKDGLCWWNETLTQQSHMIWGLQNILLAAHPKAEPHF